MRNCFFILFFLSVNIFYAQITITKTDMPVVNDTLRVSNALGIGSSNPTLTDTNYTWDYSHLSWLTQKIDTFVSVSSTPLLYQFYFNNSILYPSTKADLAVPVATPVLTTGLTLSDVFNYYKNPTNQYTQVGFGANINGLPTSVRFDSLDIIYRFPMNYGNKDSCISKYALTIPTIIYYGQRKKRVNEVDGWGTLKTPFGIFQTLRIKSTLYITDTVYVNALSLGTKINRPTEVEYKWLGQGSKIPLLQINTLAGTVPIVTSVVYRDSLRALPGTGISNMGNVEEIEIYSANQLSLLNLTYKLKDKENISVELFDITGKKLSTLLEEAEAAGEYYHTFDIKKYCPTGGVYFVRFSAGIDSIHSKKIYIQ